MILRKKNLHHSRIRREYPTNYGTLDQYKNIREPETEKKSSPSTPRNQATCPMFGDVSSFLQLNPSILPRGHICRGNDT